jgi:hypothetical protein
MNSEKFKFCKKAVVAYLSVLPLYSLEGWDLYKKFWEVLIAYFPWYDTARIENDEFNNSSIVASVFVAAVTFLSSRS